MKKRFIGKVKPFFKVEGLNLEIYFGQEVALEDWQINHPHFVFARKNGWVYPIDSCPLILNLEPPRKYKFFSYEPYSLPVENNNSNSGNVSEEALKKILDTQVSLLKGVIQDKITHPVKIDSNASNLEKKVSEIQTQQKIILEILAKKQQDESSLELSSVLLNEIKLLKNKTESVDKIVDLLEQLQKSVNIKSGSGITNSSYNKTEERQSNIKDFEERYVPKVEDLSIKKSNIVTQQSSAGSVEEAVAALKNLKKQKGI